MHFPQEIEFLCPDGCKVVVQLVLQRLAEGAHRVVVGQEPVCLVGNF